MNKRFEIEFDTLMGMLIGFIIGCITLVIIIDKLNNNECCEHCVEAREAIDIMDGNTYVQEAMMPRRVIR